MPETLKDVPEHIFMMYLMYEYAICVDKNSPNIMGFDYWYNNIYNSKEETTNE